MHSQPEDPASPFLFDFRSNLPAMEEFLCVNILKVTNQSSWYRLVGAHHPTAVPRFISLPETSVPTVDSACATFGHTIYVLGGSLNGSPTNTAQIFDASQDTWREFPRMGVPRQFASAGMIRDQMHIVGGSQSLESWAEAFDHMSHQWYPIPRTSGIPSRTIARKLLLDGRFLETDNEGLLFVEDHPLPRNRDFWSLVNTTMGKMTMLDRVLYTCCFGGYITGFEQDTDDSFVVQGFDWRDEMLPNLWERSWMIKMRGMLCIVWKDNEMINCIGILVVRVMNEMVSGSVAWRERAPLPTDAVNGELKYCGTLDI